MGRMVETVTAPGTAPGIAPGGGLRSGVELREARERLGWSLDEVARELRIRQPYLEALEDGRLQALPGNAYALGFLRTYAVTLGLDADEMSRRFRAEMADVNRKPVLSFPSPFPERGAPTGAMVLLGLVLVLCGYAGWYRLSDHARAPTQTIAAPDLMLPVPSVAPMSPQVASVMPAPGAIAVAPMTQPPHVPAGVTTGSLPTKAPVSPAPVISAPGGPPSVGAAPAPPVSSATAS